MEIVKGKKNAPEPLCGPPKRGIVQHRRNEASPRPERPPFGARTRLTWLEDMRIAWGQGPVVTNGRSRRDRRLSKLGRGAAVRRLARSLSPIFCNLCAAISR